MSQVVRPERTSQKVARSLLELAAVLADDDTDLLNVPTAPSERDDGHAHGISVGNNHGPERLTLTVEEAARSLGVLACACLRARGSGGDPNASSRKEDPCTARGARPHDVSLTHPDRSVWTIGGTLHSVRGRRMWTCMKERAVSIPATGRYVLFDAPRPDWTT